MPSPLLIPRIIHLSLTASPVIVGAVFYYLRTPVAEQPIEFFRMLGAGFAIGGALAAIAIPRLLGRGPIKGSDQTSAATDLSAEQGPAAQLQTSIITWAITEAASLVNLVFYFLTGNMEHMGAAALTWIFLALNGPKQK